MKSINVIRTAEKCYQIAFNGSTEGSCGIFFNEAEAIEAADYEASTYGYQRVADQLVPEV